MLSRPVLVPRRAASRRAAKACHPAAERRLRKSSVKAKVGVACHAFAARAGTAARGLKKGRESMPPCRREKTEKVLGQSESRRCVPCFRGPCWYRGARRQERPRKHATLPLRCSSAIYP